MTRDTFHYITRAEPSATIQNGVHFRLACCDCHLVHNVTVFVKEFADGHPLQIRITRNHRATEARRKQKREG